MQASIAISSAPNVQYVLRLADSCLILAQRLGEWCGHAPALEEDIALTNMALDLIGQSRALFTRAGQLEGQGRDEDQLAFLRDERDYLNLTLVELPNSLRGARTGRGDFAFTVLRNLVMATLLKQLWQRLLSSSDAELAAIAGKALKESRYHQQHAADWVVRLGDGTEESSRRMQDALNLMWPYVAEMFENDAVDDAAVASGLGPRWADVQEDWLSEVNSVMTSAGLAIPKPSAFRSTGKIGRHSEHMGFILAEMQHLQRAYPGGVW
ncbi:1,2-phenylacetyl-CoA epoxidase subunit PaaC [Rhodoferax sp.]|uniref:1,2-phenylacetyl-CoA epoxidase subunit PaaC n=1 Tax=Rhodoferax sp. TaxID=50421 RepID=UPI001EC0A18B|nr:1,2-phenylacetyl-CoA epoxidase subunit PaaC [Rhodoferax sp.]MBT9507602.1 phenylacetate-CoA oxygenase subunit PaaC [Rhodoferax sp.]